MKTAALVSLALVQASLAYPFQSTPGQVPLGLARTDNFNLDLNELRLLQFSPDEEPVWMTEYDKVRSHKALFQSGYARGKRP